MANEIPKLLTVREFAKALRIHIETARKMVHNGDVPSINLAGRTTRIPADVITSALKQSVQL